VTDRSNPLNSNHQRRLSVTCRHIDKLLGEMESALHVSTSGLAFPQYTPDLTPEQSRVVEDHIGRIRAELVQVLDGQGIACPPADVPVSRSLLSHLTFADIAAEELRPRYMRGYGELSPEAALDLDKIAADLQRLIRQLGRYLAAA
jgi:hypothetical protein